MSILENVSKAVAETIRNDPELMEIVGGFGKIAEANDLSQEDVNNFCKLMYLTVIVGDKSLKQMLITDMEHKIKGMTVADHKIRNRGQAQ